MSKGRGSSKGMNRICRQACALSLSCGFQPYFRWIASELNPADAASRNKALVPFDPKSGAQELQSNHAASQIKGDTKDGAHKLSPSTFRAVQQETMPVLTTKQIKEQKATSRKRKHSDSTPLAQSNVKEPCFLERQAVTPSREQSYARAWTGFLQFVKTHRLKIDTVPDLDAAVAWAVNEQFFEGDSLATPQTLLAAVKYHRQDVAKVAVLTRASQPVKHEVGSSVWRPRKLGLPFLTRCWLS